MSRLPKIAVLAAEKIPEQVIAEVREVVCSHHGLKTVLDWCLEQKPPILDTGVVTQDAFTHDLIVPLRSDVYLVYDST